jgi:hypothetical protein
MWLVRVELPCARFGGGVAVRYLGAASTCAHRTHGNPRLARPVRP